MEEWREYKLGDVCSRLRSGKGIKAESVLVAGLFPVIGGNGIRGYTNVSNFKGECAIIGRQGAYCGNVRFYEGEAYMTEHAVVVVGNELADTRFLACLLSLMHLGNLSAQSAQPGLSVQTLSKQLIQLPSIDYQRRVSSMIKSLDDKIECNQLINDNFAFSFLLLTCFVLWLLKLRNDNLQQQAQTIFKSWFIDFEPFKDNGFVESELGYIPKGWRVGTLNEIADITMGMSPSGTSYNTEGQGDVFYQGRAEFGFRFPQRNLYTTEAKRFADVDSILVSVRAPVGDINVAEEKCCIGRGLASVRSKNKCNSFILYLLQSLKPIFNTFNGEGTVFGSINKKAFEEMPIIIPEESVIQSYESIALSIDSRIKSLEIESRRLAQLRDTLLPRLMSGELKVNEIEMP